MRLAFGRTGADWLVRAASPCAVLAEEDYLEGLNVETSRTDTRVTRICRFLGLQCAISVRLVGGTGIGTLRGFAFLEL